VNFAGSTISLGSVTVYAAGATGNASPIQKLKIYAPTGIAVDASGKMYVTNFLVTSTATPAAVSVYAAGATGNDPPLRTITGSKTGMFNPNGIALDPINGDIYVANLNPSNVAPSVLIYAPDANGNVPPIGTITGAKTGLQFPGGLALDSSGNIYVPNGGGTSNSLGTVTVYAAGSVGNVAPIQTITGLYRQLDGPTQVALNSSSKHIYVANLYGRRAVGGHVAVYAAGANGMARAIRLIAGSLTQLVEPQGIALDGSNNIYVANFGSESVTVYAPGKTRDVAPINTISGSNTGIDEPLGLAIH
jgi:sugar lactone lactonase YvrE